MGVTLCFELICVFQHQMNKLKDFNFSKHNFRVACSDEEIMKNPECAYEG